MSEIRAFHRSNAIRWLCQYKINKLTLEERGSIILDFWSIDEEDPEFHILSDDIKSEIKSLDNTEDPSNVKYNPLILESLISSYKGVLNSYIVKKLNEIGIENIEVFGSEEALFKCPCCSYKTLDSKGEYDICKVCFWEDDGNINPMKYSHVNKMTLQEGQQNFILYGACSENSVRFVDKESRSKFSYRD